MNHGSPLSDRVREVFQPTQRGVVGLVDDLLELSRGHGLCFDFQDSHCYVRPFEAAPQDSIGVPLQKSVFRAVLARIAALCNERAPNTVTSYRGEGELSVFTNPPATFRVAFTNTPTEQRLEVNDLGEFKDETKTFTVLLRDGRVATVHGHALKYLQNASNSTDYGSYGIISNVGGAEVLVALFPVRDVTGVFRGDISEPRESVLSA